MVDPKAAASTETPPDLGQVIDELRRIRTHFEKFGPSAAQPAPLNPRLGDHFNAIRNLSIIPGNER